MCQMVPVSESELASGVASGKLKILAVCSSDAAASSNPTSPALQELGYDVDVTWRLALRTRALPTM